ncbi:hypothetical protein QZH41_000178 [Actinostola sp. cb2023]|nr:hypothetical protein QZH41_000178 [Actinostola sp. cb2023]
MTFLKGKLQRNDCGLWTVDCGLWTVDCGLWTVDCGLWTVDCGLWTVDCGLWTVDCGLWTVVECMGKVLYYKGSNMKVFVKREDTGRVARIELKEDQQVYDLLEASLVPLKFDKDAILCVYADKDNNVLGEATLLSEVKNIEMFVVKDKLMESKTKEKEDNQRTVNEDKAKADKDEHDKTENEKRKEKEDKAKADKDEHDKMENEKRKEKEEKVKSKDKENASNVSKTMGNIEDRLKHKDTLQEDSHTFIDQFAQTKPHESSAQHSMLDQLKEDVSKSSSAGVPLETTEEDEIKLLAKKIKAEGLEGFDYEIDPDDCVDQNESTYREYSFSSEQERRATQSNMKKFRVKIRLNRKTVEDAKKILKAEMNDKRYEIAAFNDKYCSFVYTGQFSAGGWFRTVATATSTESMDFTALEREASARTETHWAASASGYGVSAGGGGKEGSSSNIASQQTQQKDSSSVQVVIMKESAPGNTASENDLESKIKNAKNWTVFPISPFIELKKSHFTQVYDIMKMQANETNDKELEKVSDIMKDEQVLTMAVDKALLKINDALKSLPSDMKKFSLYMRLLLVEEAVGTDSAAARKIRQLRDDTKNDAMGYFKEVLPVSKKLVSAIDDFFDNYAGSVYEEWLKNLPDILKETQGYRELCEIVVKMHESMLTPLKQREDKAKEVMLELTELQKEYDKKKKDLESSVEAMKPKPNQTGPNQNQTKFNQTKPAQTNPNRPKPIQTKMAQTKPNKSKAKQSKAKQSKAKQSKAKQSKAKQSKAKQSKAKQSKAKQSKAKQSKKQSKAKQSKAKQSKAKQSKAKQSKAKQSKAKQSKAKQSKAKQSKAKQSKAKQSKAKQSKAKQSKAKQSKAKQSKAKQSKAKQSKAKQSKAKQSKAKQSKAKQSKAKQSKAKQSKAKQSKAKQSKAKQSKAKQSKAKQSKAKQSKAKQSKAKQSKAKQSKAKQSKAKQSKAKQSKAKQSKAKQSKAKQSKAKQSKAKQSKAKQSKAN